VELDLSAFTGRVPVDIVGGSVFPPIGQLTYLLTMPPYGSFWFLLATEAALPTWHSPPPEPLPEYATLVVRGDLSDLISPANRAVIEREALPAYLPKRRWFASKGETLVSTRIGYAVALPGAGNIGFTEIEAVLPDRTETYVMPMGVVWEDEISGALPQQLALTRVRKGPRVGYLTDAFALDGLTAGMLDGLRNSSVIPLQNGAIEGRLEFRPTSRMDGFELPADAEIRRLSAEQSNSSWIVGDALVMKLVRRSLAGVHPEGEMTRHLTERGFGNTAPLFGELVRVSPDGTPHTVALAQGFVRNQGDGWVWTLEYLARTVEEAATTSIAEVGHTEEAHDDVFDAYEVFARAVGTRLAEMHAVLAEPSADPAFAPAPTDPATLDAWAEGAIEQIDMAMDLLASATGLDDATRTQANTLLAHRDSLRDAARRLAQHGAGSLQTRVHGDFHLGQVLVVQGDAFIIDFEGEPARTMEQRRAKSCPMRDVAGLLRSFDYAAAAAAPGRVATSEQANSRRQNLLATFRTRACDAFLDAYRTVLHQASQPWITDEAEAALLDLFLLEKAAYEIRYEIANRPAWLSIPLTGFSTIAERIVGGGV
jgi:maltose alpha-D-glucosyltransferase/alpha-amylase